MFTRIILQCLVLTCTVGREQSPSRPAWDILARESSVVASGVMLSKSQVVHPDKMNSNGTRLPDGTVQLEIAKPSEYVVGSLYRVRIVEVIKKDGKVKPGVIITIFVPGWMPGDGSPIFEARKKYLLFLSPLMAEGGQFSGTTIHQAGASPDKDKQFDPSSSHITVQRGNGVVEMNANNTRLVSEVRAAIRTNK